IQVIHYQAGLIFDSGFREMLIDKTLKWKRRSQGDELLPFESGPASRPTTRCLSCASTDHNQRKAEQKGSPDARQVLEEYSYCHVKFTGLNFLHRCSAV